MFKMTAAAAIALAALAGGARADEVTDTLQSAMTAYEQGDIAYAMEELDFARSLLAEMKTDALVAFLPEAPEGWSREISTEMSGALGMLGGGAGAEASYSDGSEDITITIMADNPMVAGMAGMLSNAALMGIKLERVGRQKFMNQDGELTGLVDNRILVQASGGDIEAMKALLEAIDYKALAGFGR